MAEASRLTVKLTHTIKRILWLELVKFPLLNRFAVQKMIQSKKNRCRWNLVWLRDIVVIKIQ